VVVQLSKHEEFESALLVVVAEFVGAAPGKMQLDWQLDS
jgi:hypothetical protein